MPDSLIEKVYDPWGLLGKKYDSKCCAGKTAEIIMYDHTGAIMAQCECGNTDWYDRGAYNLDK